VRLALATCLLLAGCDHEDRIGKLEKQNQELQAEIKKDHAAAEYDMQAKCAKDSRLWFNENWQRDKNTILLDYTNHYNKSQNKCFIEVEYHYRFYDQSWVNDMMVWDIYENEKFGTVTVRHMVYLKPEYHNEESVSGCEVYGKTCKTVDEFNGLVAPYMSN
jgi:hypothetical protein